MNKDAPRIIDAALTFSTLVEWFYDELVNNCNAPGFLVGLSGTDSLVAFCAAYDALKLANKSNRMMGVHFAPSEDFLYDHPEAEVHLWFQQKVLPWLKKRCPDAQINVDTSIDWRCDGLRWGALMDMSVVSNDKRRAMRLPEDQYWVCGTRNRTEDVLKNYSNVSAAVSIQPLVDLWKSEVLEISKYLGVPEIAIDKSCESDCICGRMQIAGQYIAEIDQLLMVREGELNSTQIEERLKFRLDNFIKSQLDKNSFKPYLPYTPTKSIVIIEDPVIAFETGTLKLSNFNHYKHMYVAWVFLKSFSFEDALERYSNCLRRILRAGGQIEKFNSEMTRKYFEKLNKAIKETPSKDFDDLLVKCPELIKKV